MRRGTYHSLYSHFNYFMAIPVLQRLNERLATFSSLFAMLQRTWALISSSVPTPTSVVDAWRGLVCKMDECFLVQLAIFSVTVQALNGRTTSLTFFGSRRLSVIYLRQKAAIPLHRGFNTCCRCSWAKHWFWTVGDFAENWVGYDSNLAIHERDEITESHRSSLKLHDVICS